MSGARAPAGIDTLDKDDEALLAQMRDDGDGDPGQDTAPEPEPRAAPEAEPASEVPEDNDRATGTGMVPIKALHEERAARKQATAAVEEANKEVERARARFEERLRLISEAVQPAPQPVPAPVEIPDYDSDPIGHLRTRLQLAEQREKDRDAVINGFTQNQQMERQFADLRQWGMSQEQQFEQTTPDYRAAAEFLQRSRTAELQALNWNDPGKIQQQIMADVLGIAAAARQANGNFAESLYKTAVARGYQKVAPVATPTPADTSTLPPLVPEVPNARNPQRRETLRQNSTSLSSVSGSAVPRGLTPNQIGDLTEAQFSVYIEQIKNDPSKMRELFGD